MNNTYYPLNDYRNYLQHHGIKGQRWGVRNAEWYPISEWKDSQANKVAEKKERKAVRAESEYESAKRGREKYVNSMERKAAKRREQYESLGVDVTNTPANKKERLKAAKKAYEDRNEKIRKSLGSAEDQIDWKDKKSAKRGESEYKKFDRDMADSKKQYDEEVARIKNTPTTKSERLKAAKKAYEDRDRKIQEWYNNEEKKIESGYKRFQNLSDEDYKREMEVDEKASKMWADSKKQYDEEVARIKKESKAKTRLIRAERADEEYENAKNSSSRYLSSMEKKASKRRAQADEARRFADEQHAKVLEKALKNPSLLRKHVNEIPPDDVEKALNRFSRERRVEQAARDKNTVVKKDIEQYVIGPGKLIVAGYGTYKGLEKIYDILKK